MYAQTTPTARRGMTVSRDDMDVYPYPMPPVTQPAPRKGMTVARKGMTVARKGMTVSRDYEPYTGFPMPPSGKHAEFSGREYKLTFRYDAKLIGEIKTRIPGRRWDAVQKSWYVPVSEKNNRTLLALGFTLPQKTRPTGGFDFPEAEKLRPYQLEGARMLAYDFDLNGLLADEMGLGKTAQAICAMRARAEDALPACISVPGSLKANWAHEIQMWHPGATVQIINGRAREDSTFTPTADYTIINYDILASWEPLLSGFKTVVFDECHRIKNNKAQWTQAAKKVAGRTPYKIFISGTPITSRPIDFYNTLKILAPATFTNWVAYVKRYCDARPCRWGRCGIDFTGASNLDELNQIASAFMIRRLKKDVLQELPEKQRIVMPVDIDMKAYEAAELEALGMEALPAIELCKQAAIEGKMKAAVDWITDYLDSGKKLVVFATHHETIDTLEEKFPGCARIDGRVPTNRRQAIVDRFQNDDKCRLFVGNLQAAGVGVTLTAASATLTLELGWVPGEHIQAEDRVHRIGQHAQSVEAYYMIARDTIDEDIMNVLDTKLSNITEVMDGQKINPEELLHIRMARYEHRKPKAKKKQQPMRM